MNQIIIGKNVAYAAKIGGGTIAGITEVNQLAAGAIAVFASESNVLLTAANVVASMADKKGVWIAVGSGDATKGADTTIITKRLGVDYRKQAYVAPVKLVKVIGEGATNGGATPPGDLNEPTTLVAGDEAFIRVTDTTPGVITTNTHIKRYSYVVRTGDTIAIVVAALVAAINADPDSIVVAADLSSVGISLTAKNYGVTFAISLDGILINATIDEPENPLSTTDSVAINYGKGTYAQIAQLESLFSPQQGNTNKVYQPSLWWTKAAKADSAATYDTYTIGWMGTKERSSGGSLPTVAHEIIVAMPPAATQQAAFEAVMAEVFGNAETQETGA